MPKSKSPRPNTRRNEPLTKREVYKMCARLMWTNPETFAERVGLNRSMTKRQLYGMCAKLAWLDAQYMAQYVAARYGDKGLIWALGRKYPNVPWKNIHYVAKHT